MLVELMVLNVNNTDGFDDVIGGRGLVQQGISGPILRGWSTSIY